LFTFINFSKKDHVMNKSYISVWNEALGSWVAASEHTAARGKRSKAKVLAGAVSALAAVALWSPVAHAQYSSGGGTASGATSVAIGAGNTPANAKARGTSSTAVGSNAVASGTGSAAYGDDTAAAGIGAFAAGGGSNVGSSAMGAQALANQSIALGAALVTSTSTGGVAIGQGATVSAIGAAAFGVGAVASGTNALASGNGAKASAANSVALGAGSTTTANLAAAGYNPGSSTLSGTASAASGEDLDLHRRRSDRSGCDGVGDRRGYGDGTGWRFEL
jgi:hypothetical protein